LEGWPCRKSLSRKVKKDESGDKGVEPLTARKEKEEVS